MSSGAATLQGRYHDGRQPLSSPATLIIAGQEVALTDPQATHRYDAHQLLVSPRVGRAERFIALPNGGQFQCPDDPLLDRLPQEVRSEGVVAWLEQRLAVAVICVGVIVCLLLAGYFYGLPVAAKHAAARIPLETEHALGQEALTWLDNRRWMNPTHLQMDQQEAIRAGFGKLYRGLSMESQYRLEFRDSPSIGPNAFALPGGTIVITDDMVKATKSDEEVLAVLAHEIGHAELHHPMRLVLQESAAGIVAATITSDAASLSTAVAGVPLLLANTKYSREFETEADDFAFQLLKQRNLSPEAFATLMERLMKETESAERAFAFISTHPVTAERVKRARAAAERATAPAAP